MKSRLPKWIRSTHFKFGLIAATLVIFSLFISLSAYLTTSVSYSSMFRTATGTEFGLVLTGNYTEEETTTGNYVRPGESITLNPTASNTGTEPMYVFAKINTGGLEMDAPESGWHNLRDDIYYYGDADGVTQFTAGSQSKIFSDLSVPITATANDKFTPSVVAYGIQTANMDANEPATVWGFVK